MNGLVGYFIFQVVPAIGALLFTVYLAYIIANPNRLKLRVSKYKGTPKYDLYRKIYNNQFLGAWICFTLFFVTGIAYDVYRSSYTPSILAVYANLTLTLGLVFGGAFLISRALKK